MFATLYQHNYKTFTFLVHFSNIIAVCIYRYVITLGLRSKYDVDGHYFRFAARILANPPQYDATLLCYICIVCKHLITVFSGGSTYKSFWRTPPPQQDQILSFLHMFSLKSTCVGGWRPLQLGLAPPPPPPPPQREILDPPLVLLSLRKNACCV